jgi:MFS transporter, ACS family, D-galactonate transporter
MNPLRSTNPWHVPLIFALSFVIHYLDRNAIAYALPQIAKERAWSDAQVGEWGQYLLGAFFLSYGAAQMLLSGAAERWGAKRSMVLAIIGFSSVSIAVGPLGGSLLMLVALRLLLGLAESVHVPMMGVMTARLFPPALRATANSTWSVGMILATALGSLVTVPLMAAFGWRWAFAMIGAAGLVIALPLVLRYVPDAAPSHPPRIDASANFRRLPDYWLFVAAGVLNAFCGYGILGWLPTYFVRAKGLDFEALGWPLALVFSAGVVGTLAIAWLGDRTRARMALASVGFVGAAVMLHQAIAAQQLATMVALFAAAVFSQSAFQAQEHASLQKLARDTEVGAATGIYNGISLVIGGVVGSVVPGAVVAASGSFDAALRVIVGVALVNAAIMATLSIRTRETRA